MKLRLGQSYGGSWYVYADGETQPMKPKIRVSSKATKAERERAELIVYAVNNHQRIREALECIWAGVPDNVRKTLDEPASLQHVRSIAVMPETLRRVRESMKLWAVALLSCLLWVLCWPFEKRPPE